MHIKAPAARESVVSSCYFLSGSSHVLAGQAAPTELWCCPFPVQQLGNPGGRFCAVSSFRARMEEWREAGRSVEEDLDILSGDLGNSLH